MSHHYDRTGERVDQDDERTDEQATLDHIAEVRRILHAAPRGIRQPPEPQKET
jgi:hypothetical protein